MGSEQGAKIMGINLEGPFISMERVGAQNRMGGLYLSILRFSMISSKQDKAKSSV